MATSRTRTAIHIGIALAAATIANVALMSFASDAVGIVAGALVYVAVGLWLERDVLFGARK